MDRPWGLMRGAARAADAPRSVRPGTFGRIWRFARPHRRRLLAFLLLSVVGAVLAVATPVLAGRVVDAIVRRAGSARRRRSCGSPLLIAAIAVAEAGLGMLSALVVLAHRRGPDPRPAHRRVRPRAADAGRVLHPHPHRRAGQPAQQRRDRRAAGVQRHAVRRGQQRRDADADARGDAQHLLADHAARAGAAAGVRAAGPPDGRRLAGCSARRPTTTRRWAPR